MPQKRKPVKTPKIMSKPIAQILDEMDDNIRAAAQAARYAEEAARAAKDAAMAATKASEKADKRAEEAIKGAVSASQSKKDIRELLKPIVFISYTWANDDVVMAIDTWLQNKGLQTKIDKRDFFAGEGIRDEIIRVMSECNVILIFYSKQYKGKPWTEFEQELARDLRIEAKKKGTLPPRTIYLMIDDSFVPDITEANKLHIMAKGKTFESVCEEIYQNILKLPKNTKPIDLSKWRDYKF
jgi:hypothetical protein